MDYAAAKSTMCRQCGSHYVPAAPKQPAVRLAKSKLNEPAAAEVAAADSSILGRLEGLWKPQRSSVVKCFECRTPQEVSGAADSTICPKCSAHIDLKDYKITTSFSRKIRTHGDVHVTSRGDLSSNIVICRSALVEGKLRGNLTCEETATINYSGKILGRLTAGQVVVERRAEVQFFRRLTVRSIEIKGRMAGEITADTEVIIRKNGSLDGDVAARAISVEKGGIFTGQLVIGSKSLKQAELLPESAKPINPVAETGELVLTAPLPAA